MSASIDLVVVGSVGIDTVATPRERRENVLGGSASYACAAAAPFARSGMVGVVGEDFPDDYRNCYLECGIDIAGLETRPGLTFRWEGVYSEDWNERRTLSTELNVFESFVPRLPSDYRRAEFLLLGNIAPQLQLEVIEQVPGAGFIMADTMDLWIRTEAALLEKVIERADLLTLNDSEARLLVGMNSLPAAGQALLKMGPRFVLIKKGEHGSILFSREGCFLMPAFPLDTVHDPTGAGDMFAGALIGSLAAAGNTQTADVRRGMLYGSVAASFGVEDFSLTGLLTMTRAELDDRAALLRRMMTID